VWDRLEVAQFLTWADARRIEALTERPDVLELLLQEPVANPAGA
jgi:hypothetical protein